MDNVRQPHDRRRRWRPGAWLFLLALVFYAAATLPGLADFPLVGQDEPWVAAPAAKLATQGVFGNDLFSGYHGMERRTYNFPPLFLLSEALAFRWLGVGIWPARLVAVLYGAAIIVLTYLLGRRLYGGTAGTLAAWLLVGLRLAVEPEASGVPLLDLARIARYDIAVAPLVLAALLCYLAADAREPGPADLGGGRMVALRRGWRYLATGIFAGLAILAHVYGGFVLAVIGVLLIWRYGPGLPRRAAPFLIAAGVALALLPWALYIAGDAGLYRGQMLPEQARFRLWEPAFYLSSLLHEPARYRRFLYNEEVLALWPRLGIWIAAIGGPVSLMVLLRRVLGQNQAATGDRMLLVSLPMLVFLLAALVELKFYNYLVIVLPFLALNLAVLAVLIWRAAGERSRSLRLGIHGVIAALLALALYEGIIGVRQSLRSAAIASSYEAYTARIAAVIPPGSRVLALHQYWFGVYPQRYDYRSIVLAYYLSDPQFGRPAPLPMDEALAWIAPDYLFVDRYLAPELQLEQPAETIADDRRRRFRNYLDTHGARPVIRMTDPSYGELTIYQLAP